jgi:hypothetical protein
MLQTHLRTSLKVCVGGGCDGNGLVLYGDFISKHGQGGGGAADVGKYEEITDVGRGGTGEMQPLL